MEENAKTINDIVIENDVAILPDVKYVEDIKMLWDFAINENYEKYVALKTNEDGSITRYAFDGVKPIIIKDGEYGINTEYKVPEEPTEVVDKLIEVPEEPVVDKIEETSEPNNNTENVSCETCETSCETSDAEIKEDVNEKDIDALKAKAALADQLASVVTALKEENAILKDEKETLETEIAKLNSKINDFEAHSEPVLVDYEITLDDIVEFLNKHGIKHLGV